VVRDFFCGKIQISLLYIRVNDQARSNPAPEMAKNGENPEIYLQFLQSLYYTD
jgi:hypothetical protein